MMRESKIKFKSRVREIPEGSNEKEADRTVSALPLMAIRH